MEETISNQALRRIDELDRQLAEAIRMVGKAHSLIAELQEEIASSKEAHEKLLGQLKARFAAIEKK